MLLLATMLEVDSMDLIGIEDHANSTFWRAKLEKRSATGGWFHSSLPIKQNLFLFFPWSTVSTIPLWPENRALEKRLQDWHKWIQLAERQKVNSSACGNTQHSREKAVGSTGEGSKRHVNIVMLWAFASESQVCLCCLVFSFTNQVSLIQFCGLGHENVQIFKGAPRDLFTFLKFSLITEFLT